VFGLGGDPYRLGPGMERLLDIRSQGFLQKCREALHIFLSFGMMVKKP
jgi:hypothetical protein